MVEALIAKLALHHNGFYNYTFQDFHLCYLVLSYLVKNCVIFMPLQILNVTQTIKSGSVYSTNSVYKRYWNYYSVFLQLKLTFILLKYFP